jgi:peptide deformylase
MEEEDKTPKSKTKIQKDESVNEEKFEPKDLVFINPQILKKSREQELMEEGCLSVRWLYGQVKRAKKVLVKAYDETGKPFTFGGSGLMAQIFQHEIDHLDGVLFIDKARGLKEMPPQNKI